MPCFATGSAEGDARLGEQEARAEATAATRAACEMAIVVRENKLLNKLSDRTQRWIAKHDRIDKERKKEEREDRKRRDAQKKALAKLSKKEREALGIYA